MKSVIVTGGSGKAGRAAIRELLEHGYQVMNVDTVAPAEQLCHFMKTDLNDLGQAVDALRLAAGTIDRRRVSVGEPSAVIHLAGIPAPGLAPDATIFQNNMMTTYNVFSAAIRAGAEARRLGVERNHLRPSVHADARRLRRRSPRSIRSRRNPAMRSQRCCASVRRAR